MKKKGNDVIVRFLVVAIIAAILLFVIKMLLGVWIMTVVGTVIYIAWLFLYSCRLSSKTFLVASIGLFALMMLNTLKGVWPMAWRDTYLFINHQTVDELSLAAATDMALFAFIFNPLLNGPLFATIFYLTARPHLRSRLKRIAIVFLFILSSAYPVIEARIDYERNEYNIKKAAERHAGENIFYYDDAKTKVLRIEHWKTIPIRPVQFADYEADDIREHAKQGLVPDGKYQSFDENGCVRREGYYKYGHKIGIWKDYFDCKLDSETPYVNGYAQGVSKTYYPNGKLRLEEFYENGTFIRAVEYTN